MEEGKALAKEELVLRRFNPENENHFVVDEAGFPARLRQSAFRWDRFPERPETALRMECSVYHLAALTAAGLGAQGCIEAERPNWRLAALEVEEITTFQRPNMPDDNPYDVVADPYPSGVADAHPRDQAHALIRHDLPQKGADRWSRDLASKFRILPEPDVPEDDGDQGHDEHSEDDGPAAEDVGNDTPIATEPVADE